MDSKHRNHLTNGIGSIFEEKREIFRGRWKHVCGAAVWSGAEKQM